jgi:hypothetical protein
MTRETLVNTAWLQIQSSSQIQVCTTCYKSLVKLLLAELTKWEKVCYSNITTAFCINKMASCCLDVQGEGKAAVEDPPVLWYHFMLNKVNLHPHWCENVKPHKGDILPGHAMKAYAEVQKL